MRKRILLSLFIVFATNAANSQTTPTSNFDSISTSLSKNKMELEHLSKKIEIIEYDCSTQKGFITQGTERISNEIAASNRTISICSILIAILGVALGVYISRKETAVRALLKEVTIKKDDVEALKKNVDETSKQMTQLNDEIQNDMSGLYAKLRREETKALLDRLIEEPEDICNLSQLLLSRKLEDSDFNKLQDAYEKFKADYIEQYVDYEISNNDNFKSYLLLFFQHFLDQAILAPTIREYIIRFFGEGCNCAFKNDILKSTSDLVKVINESNIDKRNSEIVEKYLLEVLSSKHKEVKKVYQSLVNGLADKHMLEGIWDKLVSEGKVITPFGRVLAEKYNDDQLLVDKIQVSISSAQTTTPPEEDKKDQA